MTPIHHIGPLRLRGQPSPNFPAFRLLVRRKAPLAKWTPWVKRKADNELQHVSGGGRPCRSEMQLTTYGGLRAVAKQWEGRRSRNSPIVFRGQVLASWHVMWPEIQRSVREAACLLMIDWTFSARKDIKSNKWCKNLVQGWIRNVFNFYLRFILTRSRNVSHVLLNFLFTFFSSGTTEPGRISKVSKNASERTLYACRGVIMHTDSFLEIIIISFHHSFSNVKFFFTKDMLS